MISEQGKNRARVFLLANADTVYQTIDYIGYINETEVTIPSSVIYFFQTLIKAAHDPKAHEDFTHRLAIRHSSPVSGAMPITNKLSKELDFIKAELVAVAHEHDGEKVASIYASQFESLKQKIVSLVYSPEYHDYALEIYANVRRLNVAAKARELKYAEKVLSERAAEILPNDVFGGAKDWDPEYQFASGLVNGLRSGAAGFARIAGLLLFIISG